MYQFLKKSMQQFNIIKIQNKMGNSNSNTSPFEDKQFIVSLEMFLKEANKYDFLKDNVHKVIDEEIYETLVTMIQPLFSSIFGFFKKEMNEKEINDCIYNELIETIEDLETPIQEKVKSMDEIFSMKEFLFSILNGIKLFEQSKYSFYDLNVPLDTINADSELKDFYDNLKLLFKNIITFIEKTTKSEKELASTWKDTNKTLEKSLDGLNLMLEISDIKNNLNDLIEETKNYQPENSDDLTIMINNQKIETLKIEYKEKYKKYIDLLPDSHKEIIQQFREGKITREQLEQHSNSLISKKEVYKIDEIHQSIINNFEEKKEKTFDDITNVYNQFIKINY
jgi:DNA-directed RNA polymerase beta' subunit